MDFTALLTAFGGCAVEGVEALTIVLAVGITRGWREPLLGTLAALLALAVPVAIFGPYIIDHVRPTTLKLVIGLLVLLFGVRWLRKAILRAGGAIALHDEDAEYAATLADLAVRPRDWAAFAIAFKAVLLEGVEGAFIIFAVGSSSGHIGSAALGGLVAVFAVIGLGLGVRRPLSRVPENTLKFCVGVALSTLGTFWVIEGLGIAWPDDVVSLPVILAIYTGAASLAVATVGRRVRAGAVAA